jgi:rhamnosyltransferase
MMLRQRRPLRLRARPGLPAAGGGSSSPAPFVRRASDTAVVIPTYNAGRYLDALLPALARQTMPLDTVLIIDSSSHDDTVQRCRAWGARVVVIAPRTFNHGRTRKLASDLLPDAGVLIYMTQDAIPADSEALANLREALFSEPDVALAYGRQIPHPSADLLARQARAFNYPDHSCTKRLKDAGRLGIKTCFSSDAFAAYRRDALAAVGGFPDHVIGSEDAYVAAKMLISGRAVRYAAEAVVQHSHDYTLTQEFRRYFDIGVFYGRERWLRATFGTARGEGKRFVLSELAALLAARQLGRIPEVGVRTMLKLLGYRLGFLERHLPRRLKKTLSMFPDYWR